MLVSRRFKYLIFLITSLLLYTVHANYTKHAIYGDGNGYYSTAHSLIYTRTLNSPTILDHLRNFPGKDYVFSRVFWDVNHNPYSLGTSLFWLPAIGITSLISNNPYDLWHELAAGITGIFLMLGGMYLLEKYLLNYYSQGVVDLTITSLFFGSSIFYYTSLEPALSHQPAFFIVSLLLYWTNKFTYSKRNLLLLGLVAGLLPITRIADSILLLPIFLQLNLTLSNLLFIMLGSVISFAPQLSAQVYYYGSIFKNYYVTENVDQWSFSIVHILEYFFSPIRGLFTWSPLYLVGTIGLIQLRRLTTLACITIFWLIGASWSGYTSAGFGQRLTFSAIPYLSIGIAYFYSRLTGKSRAHLFISCLLINLALLYGFFILRWKDLP